MATKFHYSFITNTHYILGGRQNKSNYQCRRHKGKQQQRRKKDILYTRYPPVAIRNKTLNDKCTKEIEKKTDLMCKFEGKSLNQIYAPVPTDTKDILLLFVEFVFNWKLWPLKLKQMRRKILFRFWFLSL